MSWDVVMVRTKTNGEALEDISGENIVPFTQAEIAEAVKKAAAALGAAYDCADPSYQHLGCGGWSIEFNVGGEPEAESVTLHVRGAEEPKQAFAVISSVLNARLIDCGSGEFITQGGADSFERWKKYRDAILDNSQADI